MKTDIEIAALQARDDQLRALLEDATREANEFIRAAHPNGEFWIGWRLLCRVAALDRLRLANAECKLPTFEETLLRERIMGDYFTQEYITHYMGGLQ